jgi:hypothetical protein
MSSPSIIDPSVAYSADVRMQLETALGTLSVAQTGPDFVILEKAMDLPPGRAELVVRIDGSEKRRAIFFAGRHSCIGRAHADRKRELNGRPKDVNGKGAALFRARRKSEFFRSIPVLDNSSTKPLASGNGATMFIVVDGESGKPFYLQKVELNSSW